MEWANFCLSNLTRGRFALIDLKEPGWGTDLHGQNHDVPLPPDHHPVRPHAGLFAPHRAQRVQLLSGKTTFS